MNIENDLIGELQQLNEIYIPEQDLKLVLESFSIYSHFENYFVIIGHESNFRRGVNYGNLYTGIVKLKKEEKGLSIKTVVPFSSSILYAKFQDSNEILMAYRNDDVLEQAIVHLDKTTDKIVEDINIANDTDPYSKGSRQRRLA